MKFFNLSGSPHKCCNVISFRDTLIMLDCPLDLLSCLGFMPLPIVHNHQLSSLPHWRPSKESLKDSNFNFSDSKQIIHEVKECHANFHSVDSAPEFVIFNTEAVDVQRIDVVLITNYLNMFALPFLTERLGFSGVVYVTEPTYHFGRLLMEELIYLIERTPKPRKAHLWKKIYKQVNLPIPKNHKMNTDPNTWTNIYTTKELNSCFSKLKVVSFGQYVDILGLFEVSAHSSGFCIGSCNWVLKSTHEKIVLMSQTSLLTTHPKPFDPTPLHNADLMILTNLTPSPLINPDTMLGEFCSNTVTAIKNGGNVLVPCYPCGVVYDLIECIAGHLTAASLSHVPIYFVSPVADSTLAYSNILGEWLTSSKQAKLYIPDEPFIHASLVRAGRLKHFKSVSDPLFNDAFKTPCVVFTSHPSLRFGDVVHFIQLWGQSNRNLLILTEPDFPWQEAINPFLPLSMRILYIPIDTNWNFKQANALFNTEMRPNHLILHQDYIKLPEFHGAHGFPSTDLMIEINNNIQEQGDHAKPKLKKTAIHSYDYLDSFSLPSSKDLYERILVDSSLAAQIIQSEVLPGISFATVSGSLLARDNKYTLFDIEQTKPKNRTKSNLPLVHAPKENHYGPVNFPLLLDLLSKNGITNVSVEGSRTGRILNMQSPKAIIFIEESETNIIAPDPKTRARLREILSACLRKF